MDIIAVSVDEEAQQNGNKDNYQHLLDHCELQSREFSRLWSSRVCAVCTDQNRKNVRLLHRNTTSSTQGFSVKDMVLESPLVSVELSKKHRSSYTVLLICCNGEIQTWRFLASNSPQENEWQLCGQVSLLQWEHEDTQIQCVVLSADGSTVFWCDECSMGGTVYRNICSASLLFTDVDAVKVEDVCVLLEACPPCQLYSLRDTLIIFPLRCSPPDVYLCWHSASQSLAVHLLCSEWSSERRRCDPEPCHFRDLVMSERHMWSQRKRKSIKIVPSRDQTCLYALGPEGNVVRINCDGTNVSSSKLPLTDDLEEKWDSVVSCETHDVICLGVEDWVLLYKVKDGTLWHKVNIPSSGQVYSIGACLSDIFSLHVVTDQHKVYLIKPSTGTKHAKSAANTNDDNGSDLPRLMAALYKDEFDAKGQPGNLEQVLRSEPSASCFRSIFDNTGDHYLQLEQWKNNLFEQS